MSYVKFHSTHYVELNTKFKHETIRLKGVLVSPDCGSSVTDWVCFLRRNDVTQFVWVNYAEKLEMSYYFTQCSASIHTTIDTSAGRNGWSSYAYIVSTLTFSDSDIEKSLDSM